MVDLGSYLLGVAQLAVVLLSLGFAAFRLRARLLPCWSGAPARLVEIITGVALLVWIVEILGTFHLFYPGAVVLASVLVALAALAPAGGAVGGTAPEEALATAGGGGSPAATGPAEESATSSALSPIRISIAPTGTVSPTSTSIAVTKPERGAATSAIALSVSTSATVSPSLTESPTATSSAVTVPSETSRPI